MESEPTLTPREKNPMYWKISPEEERTRDAASRRTASPNTTNEIFRPPTRLSKCNVLCGDSVITASQWPHVLVVAGGGVCLLVGCLTSQQQASVSQGRICTDNFTCCHTEIEAADQTFHLTQSQYTDTGPTSPSADPITPGAWQGSHWSANFEVTGMTRPRKNPGASGIRTRDLPLSRRTPSPLGQRGGRWRGRNSSGGSVLGPMSCVMQRRGFDSPLSLR